MGRATGSRPRGPSIARILCEFCRGTAHCDPRRRSFTNRLCDCCRCAGRAACSGPRRPALPEDSASSAAVLGLHFAVAKGRASPNVFATTGAVVAFPAVILSHALLELCQQEILRVFEFHQCHGAKLVKIKRQILVWRQLQSGRSQSAACAPPERTSQLACSSGV